MAGGPHGIQYHFLGQALVLNIPLQMFVADDVQYHSVAATGVVPTGWSRKVPDVTGQKVRFGGQTVLGCK